MEPIEFIAPWYYSTAYHFLFLFLCWFTVIYYIGSNGQKMLRSEGSPSQELTVVLFVLMSFFLGLRELHPDFGDTISYSRTYNNLSGYQPFNFKTEWLWVNMQYFFKSVLGLNIHEVFVIVDFVYFGGMLICCILLARKNLWMSMLFFFIAFQTFTYAVNGIRNGFACSIILVVIAMMSERKGHLSIWLILMFIALFIHRSTMLPSVSALAAYYLIKDTKTGLRFWYASIAISLVAGPVVEQFFSALGFDDRFSSYSEGKDVEYYQEIFSHTGFRWDFLLYSSFPVLMVWYVSRYRHFTNTSYSLIANTYLFCNAFWIMVIRASFSNRFAYLSWFLYPAVMFYPLLRMNLWKDQDRKTAIIFFLYSGFTFFMFFIYYFGTTGFRGFDQYWWR